MQYELWRAYSMLALPAAVEQQEGKNRVESFTCYQRMLMLQPAKQFWRNQ